MSQKMGFQSPSHLPSAPNQDHTYIRSSDDRSTLPSTTALSCKTEQDIRVPCYCEENVWRLAFRRLHGADTSLEKYNATDVAHKGMPSRYYTVFISNEQRCCPMLAQRASTNPEKACFWDYHVILIKNDRVLQNSNDSTKGNKKDRSLGILEQRTTVFDLDSYLPYGCELEEYLKGTFFGLSFHTKRERDMYSPRFRVISAELYLEHFYSDRMHMYNINSGKWNAPPPTYDCIMNGIQNTAKLNNDSGTSNLDKYISMHQEENKEHGKSDPTQNNEIRSVFGEVFTIQSLLSTFANI